MNQTALTVKRLRRDLGLTQREFAQLLGMTNATISAYETGDRLPSYRSIHKILKLAKENNIIISLDEIRPL